MKTKREQNLKFEYCKKQSKRVGSKNKNITETDTREIIGMIHFLVS